MSGEFGRYTYSGYIDAVLVSIAEDCRGDGEEAVTYDLTRRFASVVHAVASMAYDIAHLEAGDIDDATARTRILIDLPAIRAALDALEAACRDREG